MKKYEVEIINLDDSVEKYSCKDFYSSTCSYVLVLEDDSRIYVTPSTHNKIKVKEIIDAKA